MLRFVPHTDIDFSHWDNVILHSTTPQLYAASWFLHEVSPNWGALVHGNYDYVMPLPIKKKYGVSYIVQPPLTQQLGIYSNYSISPEIQLEFATKLCSYISVRYCSNTNLAFKNSTSKQRVNYLLPIDVTYDTLWQKFSENCKRNIKKSEKQGVIVNEVSLDFFVSHYMELSLFNMPQHIWNSVVRVLTKALEMNALILYGAFFENRVCALSAFVSYGNTLYYLVPGANSIAKKHGAAYAIVATCIQSQSNNFSLIDFEGSEIAGIAQFYKGFGAYIQPYYYLQKHSFPIINFFVKKQL